MTVVTDADDSKGVNKVSQKDILLAQKIRGFKHFLWNPETNEFLGRNGKSWIKITIAYIIFYFVLGLFFWGCMLIFGTTLPENRPKWILSESVIGTNPGLSMRPQPENDIISFTKKLKHADKYANEIIKFLEKANNNSMESNNLVDCDYLGNNASESQACRFDLNVIQNGSCSEEEEFGYKYPSTGPCILLKLNKIFEWEPEAFGIRKDKKYDLKDLDDDLNEKEVPGEMKNYIYNYTERNDVKDNEEAYLNNIWISCKEAVKDGKKNVDFDYYPNQQIPGYYFPFYNQKGYQTPFIFVKITLPNPIPTGKEYKIDCTAWAKNIIPDRITKAGMARFKIQT